MQQVTGTTQMNESQRRLVDAFCFLVAVVMHYYLGRWQLDSGGFPGLPIGFSYHARSPLSGFRYYVGENRLEHSLPRFRDGAPEYVDHMEFAAFALGILAPAALITGGEFVRRGRGRGAPDVPHAASVATIHTEAKA